MKYSQLEPLTYDDLESYTYEELENSPSFDVGVFIKIKNGQTCNNLTFYPQIESGTTKTAFEQYKEERVELQLEPLRSIGTVKDEIVMRNGLYGVVRRIEKIVLNGTETESYSSYSSTYGVLQVPNNQFNPNSDVLCDRFYTVNKGYIAGENIFIHPTNSLIVIEIEKSRLSSDDLTGMRTWLAANPVTVYYQLKLPIFEPFDSATQTILRNFSTTFVPSTCYVEDIVSTTMDYRIINTN